MKLRRSVLYVPGNNQRALEKSHSLAADCVVYDLEDSVGPEDKSRARERVLHALSLDNTGRQERIVRVNGLGTTWVEEDVAALKRVAVDGVLIPKIKSAADIRSYRELFEERSQDSQALWIMAESAAGIINMDEIVASDPGIEVIMMGLEDLALETGIAMTKGREGFLFALSKCVMTAKAHGLAIIDGVFTSLDNESGLSAECEQAGRLGFDGKSLIHPRQINICNHSFSPTEAQIIQAQQIVDAWQAESAKGRSVITVNGRMIEQLHVTEAQRVLRQLAMIRAKT